MDGVDGIDGCSGSPRAEAILTVSAGQPTALFFEQPPHLQDACSLRIVMQTVVLRDYTLCLPVELLALAFAYLRQPVVLRAARVSRR